MQIIGHRGARGEAPENTLGGFQYLHDLGIRAVEFDVRQLADHSLAVIHDDNLLRTAGVDYQVAQCSSEELSRFNQSQYWPTWKPYEVFPLLSQVMHIIRPFEHIEVEVKAVENMAQAAHLVELLQQQLHAFQAQVTITSFDIKILQALQQQQSDFKRGLLVELPFGTHAIELAHQYGCTRIGWKDALVSAELVQLSQQAHLAVSVWTVNDLERAEALRDFGIQGLITDYPKKMQQHFYGFSA